MTTSGASDATDVVISVVIINKDDRRIADTLDSLNGLRTERGDFEVVVVDASEGRLDDLRDDGEQRWFAYRTPENVQFSIPHQRNFGVRNSAGRVIVFLDAGCVPRSGWLAAMTDRILDGTERVITGVAISPSADSVYDEIHLSAKDGYVEQCATISLAFRRSVFDEVGPFDETFAYGSDLDFTWRVRAAGIPIYCDTAAIVTHDWGSHQDQLRRAFRYGRASVRLVRKHPGRLIPAVRANRPGVVYALALLGLPLMKRFPAYPLALVLLVARNIRDRPIKKSSYNLFAAMGILREGVHQGLVLAASLIGRADADDSTSSDASGGSRP